MATTTSQKTNPFDVDFEAAAERIRGLNEKVFTAAKQTGTMSVDTYEQAVNNVLDFSHPGNTGAVSLVGLWRLRSNIAL